MGCKDGTVIFTKAQFKQVSDQNNKNKDERDIVKNKNKKDRNLEGVIGSIIRELLQILF